MTITACILAAGLGSRLRPGGFDGPKWLLPVGGSPIADRQLTGLASLGDGYDLRITVVTGYAAEMIDAYSPTAPGKFDVLHNVDYQRLNNWYSVLLALREQADLSDAFVVINGDVCARPEWIAESVRRLLDQKRSGLIVDFERNLTDESMKVVGENGVLREIGKTGLTGSAVGEYVGILSIDAADIPLMRQILESFVGDPDHRNEWYDNAVGMTSDSVDWLLVPAPDGRWVEVDDATDAALAEQAV